MNMNLLFLLLALLDDRPREGLERATTPPNIVTIALRFPFVKKGMSSKEVSATLGPDDYLLGTCGGTIHTWFEICPVRPGFMLRTVYSLDQKSGEYVLDAAALFRDRVWHPSGTGDRTQSKQWIGNPGVVARRPSMLAGVWLLMLTALRGDSGTSPAQDTQINLRDLGSVMRCADILSCRIQARLIDCFPYQGSDYLRKMLSRRASACIGFGGGLGNWMMVTYYPYHLRVDYSSNGHHSAKLWPIRITLVCSKPIAKHQERSRTMLNSLGCESARPLPSSNNQSTLRPN
jgi:hypothetical protein